MTGVTLALLSAVLATAKDVMSKRLAFKIDGTTSAFASFLFALPYYVILLAVLYALGLESFVTEAGFAFYILLRAGSDTLAEWFKMHALSRADLSLVTSLLALYPIFLLFTSPLLTGDPLTGNVILATVLVVIGTIVLLYQPRGSREKLPLSGIWYALGAALFFSLNTTYDRLAVQTASAPLSGFVMTLLAALFLAPVAITRPQGVMTAFRANGAPLFGRGALELAFMVTKLFALQQLAAPYVACIGRVSVLLSVVSGRVVFAERHFVRRLIASLLILAGVVIVILDFSAS